MSKCFTHILLFALLALTTQYSVSGQEITFWEEKVISTGRTTGHIATLIITNHSGYQVPYQLPAAIIPSSGNELDQNQTQPMYSKPVMRTIIPDGEETSIPLYGYCLDIFKPPVEEGGMMPPPTQWITPGITISRPPPIEIDQPDPPEYNSTGLIPLDPAQSPTGGVVTYRPVQGTFDLTKYPQTAATYIFTAIPAIEETFYDLKKDGLINTPFHSDTARESGAVLQQTVWIYASLLEGKIYMKDDFHERLITQFENQSSQPITPAQSEQLEKGTDQFWATFVLVGTDAKVLLENPIDIPIEVLVPDTIPNCVLKHKAFIGHKMDGGLACLKYLNADEAPSPGMALEQWVSAEKGIILCADGYDADILHWYCTPDTICPETKSENATTLTSRVKFRWEVPANTGFFSNGRSQDEGDCVMFIPAPLQQPSEDQPANTGTVDVLLFIEDACPYQPLDPTVMKVITITMSQSHGSPLQYKVKGPMFKRNNNFKLPVPGIVTGLAKGSCRASAGDWDLDRELFASVELPKDTVLSGERIQINAKSISEADHIYLTCESTCETKARQPQFDDNIEWRWEIISGGGLLYSKFNIDGGNEAYGRSIIFEAPKHEEAVSHTKIKLTVFNPETIQEVDKEDELVFEVPVQCIDKAIFPSAVWLTWTDQPVDEKDSTAARKKEIWNGILLRLTPPDCAPKVSADLVLHSYTPNDQSFITSSKVLKPQQRIPEGSDFKPSRSWTFLAERNNGCVMVSNLTLYGGFEVGIFDLIQKNERLVFMDTLFATVMGKIFPFDIWMEGNYREVFSNLLWLILIHGFQNIENQAEYQKLKATALEKGLTARDFEKMKNRAAEVKREYDDKHGEGSFDKMFIMTNPIFKDVDFNLIYSVWEICSKGHSCNEVCQMTLYSNSKSTKNGNSKQVKRDSTIQKITPFGSPSHESSSYSQVH